MSCMIILVTLLEFLPRLTLYYINSVLIPYKGNLTNYIKALNPAAFKMQVVICQILI